MMLILNSFVEDRLATLKNVIKEPELDAWNLYLGRIILTCLIITSALSCILLVSVSIFCIIVLFSNIC